MNDRDPDAHVRELAAKSLVDDDPTGWFDALYQQADADQAVVPWDRGAANPLLVAWAERDGVRGAGSRALVTGCGYGSDAEFVAGLGFDTVGFDVSPAAVRGARRRFPASSVEYVAADLLALPAGWHRAFDLVLDALTVQSMPRSVRSRSIAAVAGCVAPGGTVLVIAAQQPGGVVDGADDGPPWPMTTGEVRGFEAVGLVPARVEQVPHPDDPERIRWRAEFRRPDPNVDSANDMVD